MDVYYFWFCFFFFSFFQFDYSVFFVNFTLSQLNTLIIVHYLHIIILYLLISYYFKSIFFFFLLFYYFIFKTSFRMQIEPAWSNALEYENLEQIQKLYHLFKRSHHLVSVFFFSRFIFSFNFSSFFSYS